MTTKVKGLSVTKLSKDSMRLDWLPIKDAPHGYHVIQGNGTMTGDPKSDKTSVVARNVRGTSYTFKDMPPGDYTFWVSPAV
jgi:hypothetical protein